MSLINYGSPPSPDEIECTIFGPGFGEAIALHVGEAHWLIIDSCIDPRTDNPAVETYLDAIGVDPFCVKAIVASHWHDDHVRGISRVAEKYRQADFFLSGVFNENESKAFLAAYSGVLAPGQTRGTRELCSVLESRQVVAAQYRTLVFEAKINGVDVRATAWSPTPDAHKKSVAHFAQYLPGVPNQHPIRHAPEVDENLMAVVVHVAIGDEAILLGSDLENSGQIGWQFIADSSWCQARPKASAYKIAHHGSANADCESIWSALLTANPHACMTPFNRGKGLPQPSDVARIKGKTSNGYITSNAKLSPQIPTNQLKRLETVVTNLSPLNCGFGAVRFRKKYGAPKWEPELFGQARSL